MLWLLKLQELSCVAEPEVSLCHFNHELMWFAEAEFTFWTANISACAKFKPLLALTLDKESSFERLSCKEEANPVGQSSV